MRPASTGKGGPTPAVPPARQTAASAHQYQKGRGAISKENTAQISTTTSSV